MAPQLFRLPDANLEVRPDLGCLRRPDGEEVYLRPKTFQTLLFLLDQRHRVVTKDDIAAQIWPDTAVTDDAVVQCIVEIRRVLGDDARRARFIRTLPKSGYRFVGDVVAEASGNGHGNGLPVQDIAAPLTNATPQLLPPPVVAQDAAPPRPIRRFVAVPTLLTVAMLSLVGAAYVWTTSDGEAVLMNRLVADPARQPTIAVMFLENQSRTAELDWLREGLADMLVTGLSRSKSLSVVSRQQLELLLDRVGHKRETPVTLGQAVEVARRARLSHIVVGGFAKLGETIRIDLRLHDGLGLLVKTEALTIDTADDLLTQVDLLSWRLAQHFGEISPVAPGPAKILTENLEAYRHYSLGVSRANSHHSAEAVELFTRATELDPGFAMAFARIGYVHGVVGVQLEKARSYLANAYRLSRRLSERDRLQVEAWNALANLDYESAAASLTELVRAYPMEVESYARLGLILAGERKYDEAIQVFRRGLSVDPESSDLWNRLGGIYDEAGRSKDGIAARQKYVALEPAEPNAYDSLGLSFETAGRYDEAIAAYQKALDLKPDFDVAWVHLGNTYVQTGRYAAAEQAFRQYLRSVSTDFETKRAYMSLARVAHRRGRLDEAIAHLARAVPFPVVGLDTPVRLAAGDPIDRIAATVQRPTGSPNRGGRASDRAFHHAQGLLALERGMTAEALDHFHAALRERPLATDMDPLEDCLANAYLKLGRFDDAIAEYSRILQLNPRYPLVHYRLGLAWEGKRQAALARKAYEDFLRIWSGADRDVQEVMDARVRLTVTLARATGRRP